MTSIGEATLALVQVPKFYSMIHATRKQEVTCVVEVHLPYRLAMFGKSVQASGINEVPNFDGAISGASRQ